MADVLGGIALMLALMPSSMQAQAPREENASRCTVPASLPVPHAVRAPAPSDVRRMPIGGYTLALSWSPAYCASRKGRADSQCDGRAGRFGFILHGLWPEGKGGRGWPQYCAPAAVVPRPVLAENFCTTPSVQLMQHEWAKHGTCMARRPEDYFARGRALYQAVRLPDMTQMARQSTLRAGQLANAFAAGNAGLNADMIRVRADRGGRLSEIWICLDERFRYARCPASKSGMALSAPIRIRLP